MYGQVLDAAALEAEAMRLIDLTRGQDQPLSLMSIVIDRPDCSDDANPVAAALVRQLAGICTQLHPAGDVVGHIEGGAFLVLLPGTFAKGALRAAERLRTEIGGRRLSLADGRVQRCSVSIGLVTTRSGHTSYQALRSRCDAKRDDARSAGGNRVNA